MGWRSPVLTAEVRAWLAALGDDDFGRVAFHLDLLHQRQGQLDPRLATLAWRPSRAQAGRDRDAPPKQPHANRTEGRER